jgi:hypothetical protein
MAGYYGHKTLADGSHQPLTKDEAQAIRDWVDAAAAKRASDMPTAKDALSALIQAEQRLKELGWWKGGGLRVRRGDDCAVAETGSTGMWTGHYAEDGQYVFHGDYVSSPQKLWLKPLAELTSEERAWIAECDQREREDHKREVARLTGETP